MLEVAVELAVLDIRKGQFNLLAGNVDSLLFKMSSLIGQDQYMREFIYISYNRKSQTLDHHSKW